MKVKMTMVVLVVSGDDDDDDDDDDDGRSECWLGPGDVGDCLWKWWVWWVFVKVRESGDDDGDGETSD